jgi:hypothetical protein
MHEPEKEVEDVSDLSGSAKFLAYLLCDVEVRHQYLPGCWRFTHINRHIYTYNATIIQQTARHHRRCSLDITTLGWTRFSNLSLPGRHVTYSREKKVLRFLTRPKTYNRRDSQMVTHSSTSRPVQCLCMAERTGCPVLTDLWSYVLIRLDLRIIKKGHQLPEGFIGESCPPML